MKLEFQRVGVRDVLVERLDNVEGNALAVDLCPVLDDVDDDGVVGRLRVVGLADLHLEVGKPVRQSELEFIGLRPTAG